MAVRDPYRASLLTRSASARLVGVVLLVAALWGAIVWAVALP